MSIIDAALSFFSSSLALLATHHQSTPNRPTNIFISISRDEEPTNIQQTNGWTTRQSFPDGDSPPFLFFSFSFLCADMDPCTHRGVYTVCVYIAEPIYYTPHIMGYSPQCPIQRGLLTPLLYPLSRLYNSSLYYSTYTVYSIIRWLSVFPHLR